MSKLPLNSPQVIKKKWVYRRFGGCKRIVLPALRILGASTPLRFLSLWLYNNGREGRLFSYTSFQLKFIMCVFRPQGRDEQHVDF